MENRDYSDVTREGLIKAAGSEEKLHEFINSILEKNRDSKPDGKPNRAVELCMMMKKTLKEGSD